MSKNLKTKIRGILDQAGKEFQVPVVNATERVVNATERGKLIQIMGPIALVRPPNMSLVVKEVPELFGADTEAQ